MEKKYRDRHRYIKVLKYFPQLWSQLGPYQQDLFVISTGFKTLDTWLLAANLVIKTR